MRLNTMISALIVLTLLSMPFVSMQAEDMPDSVEMAKRMALTMELAKPGPEHELLAGLDGNWDETVKLWMEPGSEPIVFQGTSMNRLTVGGRFLTCEAVAGVDEWLTESLTILGFDRRNEVYTLWAVDTWGTYSISASGKYDDSTRTITMYGEDDEPILGFTQKFDMTLTIVDEDTYVTAVIFKDEVHTKGTGEHKMVEITYKRKK